MKRASDTDRLVLLFYDGHEHRAESETIRWLFATGRRYVRRVVKAMRRQNANSGFYTSYGMLREALLNAGYDVRVNDFATALRFPKHPICATGYPSVLEKVAFLSNPRVVGPGLFASPLEHPDLFSDDRNKLFLDTCDWYADMFRPYYGDRLRRWYAGFDVNKFPDGRQSSKEFDVLIYDKIYFDRDHWYPRTIAPFEAHLAERGLSSVKVRYKEYLKKDYFALAQKSRATAFFAHSETQGLAYQECLAMSVPVCAWDEGYWMNPAAKELSADPVPSCTVPYFDERCGERFTVASMLPTWDRFWSRRESYRPREYVGERLSLQGSAQAFMSAYLEVGNLAGAAARERAV